MIGVVAVIGPRALVAEHAPASADPPDGDSEARVEYLAPDDAKGLEFDAVVLVEPDAIWADGAGAAQLYIALTRATQRLVVVYEDTLPAPLVPFSD